MSVNDFVGFALNGDVENLKNYLMGQPLNLDAFDEGGRTALYSAARNNQLECVRFLVAQGADVNLMCIGSTCLHAAVFSGNLEITRFLLENGARMDVRNSHNKTPIEEASNQDIRKLLHDVQTARIEGFCKAAWDGSDRSIGTLSRLVPSLDVTNARGQTALYCASHENRMTCVQYLLANRASVNATESHGSTALHTAAYEGHIDVVRTLLEARADCNIMNVFGAKPVDESEGVVKELLLTTTATAAAAGGAAAMAISRQQLATIRLSRSALYHPENMCENALEKMMCIRKATADTSKAISLGVRLEPRTFTVQMLFTQQNISEVGAPRNEPHLYNKVGVAARVVAHSVAQTIRRYLATFGPCMPADFAHWWGMPNNQASDIFKDLSTEITPVMIDGGTYYILKHDAQHLDQESRQQCDSFIFLPAHDPLIHAFYLADWIVPPQHKLDLMGQTDEYTCKGVLIKNAETVGMWYLETPHRSSNLNLQIKIFSSHSSMGDSLQDNTQPIRRQLNEDIARLQCIFNRTELQLGIQVEPGQAAPTVAAIDNTCVVCLFQERTHLILPCGHLALCQDCANQVHQCPMCKGQKTSVVRVYNA